MIRFLSFLLAIVFAIQTIGQITTFPWTENFDGTWATNTPGNNSAPTSWININGGYNTSLWRKCTTSSRLRTGTGSAEMYGGQSQTATSTYINSDWLITPLLTLTGNESIRFYVSSNEGSSVGFYPQDLGIYIYNSTAIGHDVVNVSDTSLFTAIMPTTVLQGYASSTWIEYEINLSQFSGNCRLAFVRNQLKGGYYLNIDDILVSSIPTCARPSNITISNILSNSADISFTPSHSTDSSWYLYYKTISSILWDSLLLNTTNYTLSNLLSGTDYQINIKTNCNSYLSEASPTRAFFSKCAVISTLPFSDDFDSYSTTGNIIPACWTRSSTYPNRPYITGSGYNGNHLQFYVGTLGTFNLVSTPEFDSSIPINTLRAKFKYKKNDETHKLFLGVMTNPQDSNTFVPIDTVRTDGFQVWEDYEVYFDKYLGSGHYIAFKLGSSGPNWQYAYMDNLEISQIPICKAPKSLTLSNLTSSTIKVSWTPRDLSITSYWLFYKENLGSNLDSVYVNSDTVFSLTNLNPGTEYICYLKSDCGSNLSEPSFVKTFKTSCIGISSLPYTEYFDSYGTGADVYPSCWAKNSTLITTPSIGTVCYSAPGSLYISSSTTNRALGISRPIDSTIVMNTLRVKFKMRYSNLNNSVQVGVMTDPLDYSTFVPVGNSVVVTEQNVWQDKEITLESYNGQGRYIAILSNGLNSAYIDNFTIDYIPSCAKPQNVIVSSFTNNTATISWTEGHLGDNSFILYYKKVGANNYDSVLISNNTSHTLTNLQDATNYKYYLATNCLTNISEPTYPGSFLTLCGEIVNIPYYDNFDSYDALATYPYCWQKNVTSSSSSAPNFSSSYYASSPNSLYFYAAANNRCTAIIKKMDSTTNLNTLLLKFKMYSSANTVYAKIGVMSDPNNWATFVPIDSVKVSTASQWQDKEISLSTYTGNSSYIAISIQGTTTSSSTFYIDDLVIDKIPSCAKPTAIIVSNITPKTADINLTPALISDNAWKIKYKKTTSLNWDSLMTSTNLITLTNLESSSMYIVEVRTQCSNSTYSDGKTQYFSTPCSSISYIPYVENFDTYGTSTYPSCWGSIRTYSSTYPVIQYNAANSVPGTLVFRSANNKPTVAITPILDSSISYNNLLVKFKMFSSSLEYKIQVGVMTNPTQYSTFIPIGNPQTISNTNVWEQKVISLTSAPDSARYIALVCLSPINIVNGSVDNFSIENIPPCSAPASITFANTDATSTDIDWIAGNTSAWWLYYKPTTASNYDSIFVYNKPFNLSNLNSNTNYDIYFITDCGGIYSSPSQSLSFKTDCLPISTLPWSDSFESISQAGKLPDCWKVTNITTGVNTQIANYGYDNRYAHTGTRAMYFIKGCSDTIFTPGFNLTSGTSYLLSFWYITDGLTGWNSLSAGVYSAKNSQSIITSLTTLSNINNTTYQKFYASFTPTADGTYYFGINCQATTNPRALTIDDMSLNVSTCIIPDSVQIPNVKATEVDMSWAIGTNTLWQVESKVSTSSAWTKATTSTNNFTFTNLIPNTKYQFRVASLCNGSIDTSAYFTTSAKTTCVGISSFPYVEDFNSWGSGTNAFPICWNKFSYYSTVAPYISQTNGTSLYFQSNNNLQTYAIIGPIGDSILMNTLRIKYSIYSTSSVSNIQIGVMTDRDSLSTFVPVGTINNAIVSGQWEVKEVPFNTYTGNGKYIAISTATPASTYSEVYIDNVIVDYIPSCAKPSNITTNSPTQTTINIDWTKANISDSTWWIFYKPTTNSNYDSVLVSSQPPYTLQNLIPGVKYDFYIRTACSTEISESTLLGNFFTTCMPITSFPWNEGFESDWTDAYGISNSLRPNNCWMSINGSSSTYLWRKQPLTQIPTYVRTGQGSAQLYGGNALMNDYLISPIVTLTGNQKLTFWGKGYSAITNYPEHIWVKLYNVTANGDIDNYADTLLLTNIGFINDTNQYTWNEYEYSLSGLVGDYRIVFARVDNVGIYYHIDDMTILDQSACSRPFSVTTSNVQTNQATISWVPGVSTDLAWKIFYTQVGSVNWDSVSVNANPYTLTGLVPNSEYQFKVHTTCSNGTISDGRVGSFRTACGIISLLPWYESFDTYGAGITTYPTCWSKKSLGTVSPYVYTSGFNGNALYFSVSSTSNYAIAMTPEISSVLPINTLKLNFKYRSDLAATDTLHIGIMTDTTETSWIEFAKITGTTAWADYQVNLSTYIGMGKYIGFRVNPNSSGYSYGHLDNLVISSNINCVKPDSISVINVTKTSADIVWTSGAGESNWQIKQGSTGAIIDVASTSFYAINLTQGTTYTYYIRSNCGYGSISDWESIPFTTATMPTNPTITTSSVTTINHNSATFRGMYVQWLDTVNAVGFEYKTSAATSWTNQALSTLASPFSYNAIGLTPSTLYKVRAYATTKAGNFYGDTVTFTTAAFNLPIVTTDSVQVYYGNTSAKFYGAITQGTESIIARGFEYKTASQDWSLAQDLTAIGTNTITATATGLVSGANYDVRAYAETQSGKTYGAEKNFNATSGINDIEVNIMSVSLYPNPASTTSTLVLKGIVAEAKVIITDVQGRTINTFTMKSINGEAVKEINVNSYSKGVYYVRIQNANTISTQKLIIR